MCLRSLVNDEVLIAIDSWAERQAEAAPPFSEEQLETLRSLFD